MNSFETFNAKQGPIGRQYFDEDDGITPIVTLPDYPPADTSAAYRLIRKTRLATDVEDNLAAMELSRLAITEAQRARRPLLECSAMCQHAIALSCLGLINEALTYAQDAFRIAQAVDDLVMQARAYGAIAYVALDSRDDAEAIKMLERALDCATKGGSNYDHFWSLNNLAHVHHDQATAHAENEDTAAHAISLATSMAFASSALKVAQRTGVWIQNCFALMNLGNGEYARGNFEDAMRLVDQYTSIAKQHGQTRILAYGNLDYARLFAADGRHSAAIDLLTTQDHREKLCTTDDMKLRTHDALAQYCKVEQRYADAVVHLETARTLERRIQAAQADRHIRALTAKLETEEALADAKHQRATAKSLAARNAKLERDRQELKRSALHDALTGLGNRRAADTAMADRLRAAQECETEFSVCYLDLDHFKSINDRFGHQIGDQVLVTVGGLLERRLRGEDRVFRIGGEEFLILLCEDMAMPSLDICERLRSVIARHKWSSIHPDLSVTASFGVSTWDGDTDGDTIIKRADTALYAAKENGRNRVMCG